MTWRLRFLGLFHVLFFLEGYSTVDNCDIYLRYNKISGELGVYAGKTFHAQEQVEQAIGIPVPYAAIFNNELVNYAEGFNDSHALVSLGYSMLYNHLPGMLEEAYQTRPIRKTMFYLHNERTGTHVFRNASYGLSNDVYFQTEVRVMQDEEMYLFYGDTWFADRDMIEEEESVIGTADDRDSYRLSGCLSKTIRIENGRIFADCDIQPQETIEVVRVLLLPESQMISAGPLVEFLWWKDKGEVQSSTNKSCTKESNSPYIVTYHECESYALLLSGKGSLYRGISNHGEKRSSIESRVNVLYDWWTDTDTDADTDTDTAHVMTDGMLSVDDTINVPVPKCGTRMFISFTAKRFIPRGEELIIDISEDASSGRKVISSPFFRLSCL